MFQPPQAHINQIAVAVPPHDIHAQFRRFAPALMQDARERKIFAHMAERSGIEHRYSVLPPGEDAENLDAQGFYRLGAFPNTSDRMRMYQQHALNLAVNAIDALDIGPLSSRVTHLIITSCTGFYAPGLDIEIVRHYTLKDSVERSIIGFMGCYAAINALKLARHITRSTPDAGVLVVNLELCTLHLSDEDDLAKLLPYLLFADGCAASFISADPQGIALESFHSTLLAESAEEILWHITDQSFSMHLSSKVAGIIGRQLPLQIAQIAGRAGIENIAHWAVHPGGKSILETIEKSLSLPHGALEDSYYVLRNYGNMSSATVMFVLKRMLEAGKTGAGCALAFGPGMTSESMNFRLTGRV